MWSNFLLNQLAKPLIRRMGTAVGIALGGYGIEDGQINLITGGLVAAAGVALDLVQSYREREGRK